MIVKNYKDRVGKTPVVKLELKNHPNLDVYSKLEFSNPTGSVKDRAAVFVIDKLLKTGEIDQNTTLVESSSGNFGIALASYCRQKNLKFICVVDPHITNVNECLMRLNGAEIIKVTEPDENGGYLLNRIRKVKEIKAGLENSYWVNQYCNPYNAEAYYNSLGQEICDQFERMDYLFLGISSGGTITGVSKKVKEHYPNIKVIAVDIEGSVIFGFPPKKRFIPGIGSSMVPDILRHALIDDVVMMDEVSTIESCRELLNDNFIFAGGSSGSVYGAIKKYFKDYKGSYRPRIITIFPDRGERYISTIYNDCWCRDFLSKGENVNSCLERN